MLFRIDPRAAGAALGFVAIRAVARGAHTVGRPLVRLAARSLPSIASPSTSLGLDGLQLRAGAQFTTGRRDRRRRRHAARARIRAGAAGLGAHHHRAVFILYVLRRALDARRAAITRASRSSVSSPRSSANRAFSVSDARGLVDLHHPVRRALPRSSSVRKPATTSTTSAMALFGWARGGPAKVAVVSGVMFGSISGSSVANVVASGMVTIPMMRRVGYDRADRRGDRGDLLDRRTDHAAGAGRRRLPHGRDHRHPLRRDRARRGHSVRSSSTSPAGFTSICTRCASG